MPLNSTIEIFNRPSQLAGMMADVALGTRPDFAMAHKEIASFPRRARLLRHADFERVYKQGRRHFSASMTVFYSPRTEVAETIGAVKEARVPMAKAMRVGFTVGRALGGAVRRNKIKRRLREATRLALPSVCVAADVVINPKKSLLATDFSLVLNEVTRAFAVIEQKLSHQRLDRLASEAPNNKNARIRNSKAENRS